jgi:hypothetical protein
LEGCSSGFLPIVCGKYQLPTCLWSQDNSYSPAVLSLVQ